jgi:hypothetical protein
METRERFSAGNPASPGNQLSASLQQSLGGQLVVRRELGRGGTAHVYLADDLRRGVPVAVKVLRPELLSAMAGSRFLREIEIVRQLDHPNVLPLYDSGPCGDTLFYTMPFVAGATLRERLQRERPMALPEVLAITRQVALALEHAHGRGIIHRDIKPANILLGTDAVLVADFGIARAINIASGDTLTSAGIAIGTPEYMSPEQASGGQLDARCDIYALGCMMYEMLTGSPPFTGPTAEAIIARHRHDAPHSVRAVRPSVPPALERLVLRTLEKVPVDRFASAAELVAALDAIDPDEKREVNRPLLTRPWRIALGAVAAGAAVGLGWWVLASRPPALDQTRIVVFPPGEQGSRSDDGTSEAVATYIGYALRETRPLKWIEAWELSDAPEQELARMSARAARRMSARERAAYFIDGTILRRPDSAIVVLRLHSVAGDSIVATAGASGLSTAYLPQLALRAVAELLPSLVQPGATVDLRPLSERSPMAIAHFLQGERAYRRMQFPTALEHYQAAVHNDSAFAIAALKGAQTATWLSRPGVDSVFVLAALHRADFLTPAQTLLARGLRAYVTGNPDSAASIVRAALRADSTLPGGWTVLGEIYARSLVSEPAADSLARWALSVARKMDRAFGPTLVLLEEMALRDGNVVEARALRTELGGAGADTTHAIERALMWRCVEKGVAAVNWNDPARKEPLAVLDAGRVLARAGSQPGCARAALRAAFESDSATPTIRRGALLALNGLLLSGGRAGELRELFTSPRLSDMRVWRHYLEDAAAGLGFDAEARVARDSLGSNYAEMASPSLWLLGAWASRHGTVAELNEIAGTMRGRSASSRTRPDRLIAAALDARLALRLGDTTGAILRLRALKPNAIRRDIAWWPWEGLGAERLLLAEVLLEKGEYREAIRTASLLDATEPVPYLLYLRPSLVVRQRAARALGDQDALDVYRWRLDQLSR